MKSVSVLVFLGLLSLSITHCGHHSGKKKSAWKPYAERIEEEERLARKAAGLRARSVRTPESVSGKMMLVAIDSFDREGRLISSNTYESNGTLTKQTTHRYEGDRLVLTVQKDDQGSLEARYGFDAEGRKISEAIISLPNDTLLTRSYKYNESGQEIEAWFYRRANNSRLRKATQYDAEGRPSGVQEFDGDTKNWEEKYKYAERKLEAERFGPDGKLTTHFVMVFDEKDHCTSMEHHDPSGKIMKRVLNTYDAEGKLLKDEDFGSGSKALERSEYRYDEKGMRAVRITTYGNTSLELHYENRYY